ncbi:MAG: M23 family metallopeptidase, partial [Actinomycetota bacterium]|nr:M23 family metallopeptidase [Actinomycetota bacterium]
KEAPAASSRPKFVSASYSYASLAAASVPVYGEYQIAEGCWRATSTFYFQTQHGSGANKSADDGISTGFTKVGRPNYWGEYTHGSLGYGRCASTYYTNDYYGIDYPLNKGDYVFSPFSGGTVTFAGRNTSHANYGIFVVIKSSNGKYVSMSAHLNSLAAGIRPGAVVNADTVIGYAGDTGDPNIPVGEPHLHQAFYRYPAFKPDGSPYGGRGLQAIYHRYVGTAARTGPGVYQFVRPGSDTSSTRTKGESISN